MKQGTVDEAAKEILTHQKITFLTGAGVSTPSGVPDYRSLTGIYHGMEQPEYLLSHQAMVNEPDKFYQFVKKIYHPEAKPNIIHLEMAQLAKEKNVWVVSQNIDGLHAKAKSPQLVNFHGSLYQCHCRKCKQTVDWKNIFTATNIKHAADKYARTSCYMVKDSKMKSLSRRLTPSAKQSWSSLLERVFKFIHFVIWYNFANRQPKF